MDFSFSIPMASSCWKVRKQGFYFWYRGRFHLDVVPCSAGRLMGVVGAILILMRFVPLHVIIA